MKHASRVLSVLPMLLLASCQVDQPTEVFNPTGDASPSPQRETNVSVGVPTPCQACILGPLTVTRQRGAPEPDTITFLAAGGYQYVVDVDDVNGQGTEGTVELNGKVLALGGGAAHHFNGLVRLSKANTLVIRLGGKPGSWLRIAIWPPRPVVLDSVTLSQGSLVALQSPGIPYDATVTNLTLTPLSDIDVQAWIVQPSARRSASRTVMFCGAGSGVLPPGACVRFASVVASNDSVGFGTLVPGAALAVIQVRQNGATVLDSVVVPIVVTGVLSVNVIPTNVMLQPLGRVQLVADVKASAGIPTTVRWSSSNTTVAVVDTTGIVTGIGPSGSTATVVATSTADRTKTDTAQIAVYDFQIVEPASPVLVSTGAVQPPANPLSVTITAKVCMPSLVAPSPFDHVEFFTLAPSNVPFKIGSTAAPYVVLDAMGRRCFHWPITWTPGLAFSLGTQTVFAAAYNRAGAVLHSPQNGFITTVVP